MVKDLINDLNENKFFVGCMMIFVTIGGRFVISELNDSQKEMIHNPFHVYPSSSRTKLGSICLIGPAQFIPSLAITKAQWGIPNG